MLKVLTPEEKEAFKEVVKEILGVESFVLIGSEATLPCPDELSGVPCLGHKGTIISEGVKDGYVACMIADAYKRVGGTVEFLEEVMDGIGGDPVSPEENTD